MERRASPRSWLDKQIDAMRYSMRGSASNFTITEDLKRQSHGHAGIILRGGQTEDGEKKASAVRPTEVTRPLLPVYDHTVRRPKDRRSRPKLLHRHCLSLREHTITSGIFAFAKIRSN